MFESLLLSWPYLQASGPGLDKRVSLTLENKRARDIDRKQYFLMFLLYLFLESLATVPPGMDSDIGISTKWNWSLPELLLVRKFNQDNREVSWNKTSGIKYDFLVLLLSRRGCQWSNAAFISDSGCWDFESSTPINLKLVLGEKS